MSYQKETAGRLHCDAGCGAQLASTSARAARAEAASAGWVFPPQLKLDRRPSKMTHDVCPTCAPTFEPRLNRVSKEWEHMSKEERRLIALLRVNRIVLSDVERERLQSRIDCLAANRETSEDAV